MGKKLNSNHLKLIAIIAMTIDHVADLIYPSFPASPIPIIMHVIGRLTAPIMWFFICEGFFYTKNLKKYMIRMFLLAIVSHFAYNFAFGINLIPFTSGSIFNQTSVIWPLACSLIALWITYKDTKLEKWQRTLFMILICVVTFPSDWSCIAVMSILTIYKYRGNLEKQTLHMLPWILFYAVVSFFFVDKMYALVQFGVILVYPFMKMYNGERGKAKWMKWFFYIYYPAHLVLIGILRMVIYGTKPILF